MNRRRRVSVVGVAVVATALVSVSAAVGAAPVGGAPVGGAPVGGAPVGAAPVGAAPVGAAGAGVGVARAAPGGYAATRLIGGPSNPGLSAWGVAYNPVSNELLVGDYVTSQVRRMTPAGVYLGDLSNPGNRLGGVASALGVDPRDGSIYLAVTGEGRTSMDVNKYSKSGAFLYGLDMPASTTWLAVDKDGYLWVPVAYKGARVTRYKVDDATKSATAVLTIAKSGSAPGEFGSLTGLGTDSANNIYVADVVNKVVHSYTSAGVWRFDLGKGLFPGDIRGVAVDRVSGRVYVANSAVGKIEVFTTLGAHVQTFGSLGEGDGQFVDGARQITVASDGTLYAADYGAQRVQRFSAAGAFLAKYPNPPMPMDPAGIAQSRALDVDPVTGDVLVADAWGQRVLRYSPDGTLLDSHGRRGSTTPNGMNYPKGVAVDPTTRNVWVANFEGAPYLVGYDKTFSTVVRKITTPRFINDLEWSGGLLYALERRPGTLHVYDPATGAEVRTWVSTKGLIRGVGVDPLTKNVWITSDTKPEVYVLSPAGALLRTVTLTGLGWDVAIRGDNVYVANTVSQTVQVFNRTSYAALGTIGSAGSGLGQLKMPSGLAFGPGGDLFVLETGNSRVTQFSAAAGPVPETTKPTVSFGTGAPVVSGQIRMTGSAGDASGVATVSVRIRDNATGRYFHGALGTWVTSGTWNAGIVWGPITATSWRFTVPGTLPGRSYTVNVRAQDRHGNTSSVATTTVAVP